MKITVSLAQMDIRLGRPEENLERVRDAVREAASRGSALVVLPELWSTGYDLEHAQRHATGQQEGVLAGLADLARRHGLYLVGSTLVRGGKERPGNTTTVLGPDGAVAGAYTKIHLFGLMEEDRYLEAGDRPGVVEAPWGRMGLAICYDLRFPELFRTYALAGCGLVVIPAEWPQPRLAHWRTLLAARAIENQMFVAACNRVGSAKGTTFCGHSALVDPWGETVLEGGEKEALLTAEIDLARVAEVRARIPVLTDRRPEAYEQRP